MSECVRQDIFISIVLCEKKMNKCFNNNNLSHLQCGWLLEYSVSLFRFPLNEKSALQQQTLMNNKKMIYSSYKFEILSLLNILLV